MAQPKQVVHKVPTKPLYPTTVRSRLPGGRVAGTDSSLWCYRSMPMAPVVDAASPAEALSAAGPLIALCEQLAQETRVRTPANRRMNRGAYRELHLLLVNIPASFTPPRDHPLAGYLHEAFSTAQSYRRVLLVGVRLRAKVAEAGLWSKAGISQAIDSVAQTIRYGGAPLSDYDEDYLGIDRAMTAAGMRVPSSEDLALANSWWNGGRSPEAPLLVHADHLHVFGAGSSARAAARLVADDDTDCLTWPELPQHHTLAFGCLYELELRYVPAESPLAQWVPALLAEGAAAISIRARVEPPKVTREELRRRRKQYRDDINERLSQGKMERAEQEELYADLDAVESIYATQGPPTLVDCGVLAAFVGHDERFGYALDHVGRSSGLSVVSMVARQEASLAECWLASPVRATPHLHDFPVQTVAASGLPSLSVVGDQDGALVGFTERDRQPAWLSPVAASRADGLPCVVVPGQTGSGKSLWAMFMADQLARLPNGLGERTPVVIIDPKAGSDFTAAVQRSGGRVASLDDLLSADGVYDPMRFSITVDTGVELAASMLMSINPWGTSAFDYETPLVKALSYGARAGADCIGVALQVALRDGQVRPQEEEMVERVLDLAASSPMFRACVGMEQGGPRLRASEGITLVMVGSAHLDLPEPGAIEPTLPQRIALALVRMMVFGSAMALNKRRGVIMLDEGWVFLSAGKTEVERLGRLARSQQVLPIFLTQRVTDALNAGLAGYISRGLILPIHDEQEAVAACELFKLEPTPERIGRITANATVGATTAHEVGAPNWASMRALRDPVTRKVLRGTIGIYCDLEGRAVPVEIKIPDAFLAAASTNPEDIERREREDATRRQVEVDAREPAPLIGTATPAPANQEPVGQPPVSDGRAGPAAPAPEPAVVVAAPPAPPVGWSVGEPAMPPNPSWD
ncbi:MAG: ATP-binding protein [Actinomycetota bacterium]|nr:ATP-binding protein [Actinomycetota bacterium]